MGTTLVNLRSRMSSRGSRAPSSSAADHGLGSSYPVRPATSRHVAATVLNWRRIAEAGGPAFAARTPIAQPGLSPSRRPVLIKSVNVFDPDRLSDMVPGGHLEHRLLEPGPFEARALHVEAGNFRLDCLRYSACVALRGRLPAGEVALGFALRMPDEMVAFGIPQHSFALTRFDPTADFEMRLPAGGEWVMLTLDRDVLDAAVPEGRAAAYGLDTVDGVPLRVPDPQRRRLASLLRSFIDGIGKSPIDRSPLTTTDDWERALVDAFVDAYAAARMPQSNGHGALARRRRLVARTEEYVFAHIDDSLRMKRLCRDVGASARTLEYAFKGIYGIGVMEALRMLRLNEVRKRLLRSPSDEVTVTSAAMDWGFWHLGEFAGAYKRLFGELPSQTLRLSVAAEPLAAHAVTDAVGARSAG